MSDVGPIPSTMTIIPMCSSHTVLILSMMCFNLLLIRILILTYFYVNFVVAIHVALAHIFMLILIMFKIKFFSTKNKILVFSFHLGYEGK